MQKTLKMFLVAAPIAIGGYLLYKYMQSKKATSGSDAAPANSVTDNSYPLQFGSKNALVKNLQHALGVQPETGYFGPLTLAALKKQSGKSSIKDGTEYSVVMAALTFSAGNKNNIGLALDPTTNTHLFPPINGSQIV